MGRAHYRNRKKNKRKKGGGLLTIAGRAQHGGGRRLTTLRLGRAGVAGQGELLGWGVADGPWTRRLGPLAARPTKVSNAASERLRSRGFVPIGTGDDRG